MSQESESNIRLKQIRINVQKQFIELETEDGSAVRYSYAPGSRLLQTLHLGSLRPEPDRLVVTEPEVVREITDQAAEVTPTREKQPTLRLSASSILNLKKVDLIVIRSQLRWLASSLI